LPSSCSRWKKHCKSAALVEDDFETGKQLEEIQTTTVVAALAGD